MFFSCHGHENKKTPKNYVPRTGEHKNTFHTALNQHQLLKVVSRENKGGSKVVLIDVNGPCAMELGIILLF
jgi:hypothetical protein